MRGQIYCCCLSPACAHILMLLKIPLVAFSVLSRSPYGMPSLHISSLRLRTRQKDKRCVKALLFLQLLLFCRIFKSRGTLLRIYYSFREVAACADALQDRFVLLYLPYQQPICVHMTFTHFFYIFRLWASL